MNFDSLHDRYGNYRGYNLNLVTEVERMRVENGLDSIEWIMRPASFDLTVRKGDKVGKAQGLYIEDAVEDAIRAMKDEPRIARPELQAKQDLRPRWRRWWDRLRGR